jgi:cytochrome b6-f complex iron-sulfur subunit
VKGLSHEHDFSEQEDGIKESKVGFFSRRKLFSVLGFTSLFAFIGGCSNAIVAIIFPRLNFEPSTKMSIGRPEDFQVGQMKLIDQAQVYVFRDKAGLQAVSGVCTHLGCSYKPFGRTGVPEHKVCKAADMGESPDGAPVVDVFAFCPCHGSVFCRTGEHVGGPAPRPLPFFNMEISADGRIMVDKGANALTDKLSQASGEGVAHNLYFDLASQQMVEGPYPSGADTEFDG